MPFIGPLLSIMHNLKSNCLPVYSMAKALIFLAKPVDDDGHLPAVAPVYLLN